MRAVCLTGGYVAAEASVELYPRRWKPDGTRRVAIVGHGAGGSAFTALLGGYLSDLLRALTNAGFPILVCDLGGPLTFGNDLARVTRMGQAWTWAKANMGIKTDKAITLGSSMGNYTTLGFGYDNPTEVAAHVGVIPGCALDDAHHFDRGSYGSAIEAAYTDLAGFNAAVATHDPAVYVTAPLAFPSRFFFSGDDPVIPTATVQALATAAGGTAVNFGSAGHTVQGLDPRLVVDFLAPYSS